MDALVALGDHRPDAEQRGPLAAQSRDEPEPYSLPARMTSGTPSAAYFIAASKMRHLLAVGQVARDAALGARRQPVA